MTDTDTFRPGTTLDAAVDYVINIANAQNYSTLKFFNGTPLTANAGDNRSIVLNRYYKMREYVQAVDAKKEEAKMQTKEAIAQRLAELRETVASLEEQLEEAEAKSHQEQMAETYLSELPEEVTDTVYSLAYQEGHSAGLSEVENYYSEFAGIAEVAYQAGLEAKPTTGGGRIG